MSISVSQLPRPRGLLTRTTPWLLLVGGLVGAGAVGVETLSLGLGGVSLAVYMVVVGGILLTIRAGHPHDAFGPANVVTLVRAGMIALLAATLFAPTPPDATALVIAGLAFGTLALDGIDGWLARRSGLSSAFGARFDLEIDALFVMVLAALAYANGKAGIWVLAIGAMRYAFIALGAFASVYAAPLFDSMRRKTVCVVQVAALSVLLLPQVEPPLSVWIAALALVMLVWSFAVDIVWLRRREAS